MDLLSIVGSAADVIAGMLMHRGTNSIDHRYPQLPFAVDELDKLLRRHCTRRNAERGQFLLDVLLSQECAQVMTHLLHDRGGGAGRRNEGKPSRRGEARQRFGYRWDTQARRQTRK